jgi:hypothetical protein
VFPAWSAPKGYKGAKKVVSVSCQKLNKRSFELFVVENWFEFY